MLTNILRKGWKPIPLEALFALLPPKAVGERGGLRAGRPQGVCQACGATQQECHGEHRQSCGHRGQGAGDSGPSASFPHTPLHNSLSHTHRAALCHGSLHSAQTTSLTMVTLNNTLIRPCKTSPQSNTQPHCAQHQVTGVCIHSWRIPMHTYSRSLHSNYQYST